MSIDSGRGRCACNRDESRINIVTLPADVNDPSGSGCPKVRIGNDMGRKIGVSGRGDRHREGASCRLEKSEPVGQGVDWI